MRWSRIQRVLVVLLAVALAVTALSSIQALPAGAQEVEDDPAVVEPTSVNPEETPALEIERVSRDSETGVVEVEIIAPTRLAGDRIPQEAISVQVANSFIPFDYVARSAEQLEVVLVLDVSGSMRGEALDAAKLAARSFIDQLPQSVRVGVVAFDSETDVIAPIGTPVGDIAERIDALTVGSDTALYDALLAAEELFQSKDKSSRRVIVALTDGADSASATTPEIVATRLRDRVQLFGIGLQTGETDTEVFQELSEGSGGTFSTSSTQALLPLYEDLAARLSSRFVVTFDPGSSSATRAFVILSHQGTVSAANASFPAFDAPSAVTDGSLLQAANTAIPYNPPTPYRLDPNGFLSSELARNIGIAMVGSVLFLFGLLAAFPSERMTVLAQSGKDRASNVAVGDLTTRLEGAADRRLSVERRQRMSRALERAGLDLRASEYVVIVVALSVATFMIMFLFSNFVVATISFFATVFLSRFYVRFKGRKRSATFVEQLPSTLQLIAGALRAGYALPQAAETVAAETLSPTSDEFHRLVTEHRLGRDFSDALHAMDERLQAEDFTWVVQALDIHRQVGGDLAEVLENVTRTIRDRSFIRRQFAALSAEGRYSAYLIVSLPFVVVIALSLLNPDYISALFDGARGLFVTMLALTLMAIGSLWMKVLMKVKF